jgi:hypothetical protein
MQVNVKTGDLEARAAGEHVIFTIRQLPDLVLALDPLAAHNLGVVLPGLARDASDAVIGASVMQMTGIDPRSGPWVVRSAGKRNGNSCRTLTDVAVNVRDLLDTGHRAEVLGRDGVSVIAEYPARS